MGRTGVVWNRQRDEETEIGGKYRGKRWKGRKGREGKEGDSLAPQTKFLDPPLQQFETHPKFSGRQVTSGYLCNILSIVHGGIFCPTKDVLQGLI
jgi:hypothetical protein